MGAHPKAPSQLVVGGEQVSLARHIQDDPIGALGSVVATRYRLLNKKEPVDPKPGLSHAAQILYMAKGEELNEKFYANLRDQYTVVIEDPVVDDKVAEQ